MTQTQRGVWPQLVFMAAVAALVVFVFLARPAKGADFEVVNRVPPTFTVVNRVQPAPVGETAGGVLPHQPVSIPAPVLLGWNVTFSDGSVRFVPVAPKSMPAPAVPVRQPFRGGYDPDHQCNNCGASQYVVAGFNSDGTHNHRCPRCNNVWRH